MKKYIPAIVILTTLLLTGNFIKAGDSTTQTRRQPRNYMLVFDVRDYSGQIKHAVSYFFDNVFKQGDQLILVTPKKLVGFSRRRLKANAKTLTRYVLDLLKTDIATGASMYRQVIKQMTKSVNDMLRAGHSIAYTWRQESEIYQRQRDLLDNMREEYCERLVNYSRHFRGIPGENHMVLVYQQQIRPVPDAPDLPNHRDFQKIFFADNPISSSFDFQKVQVAFRYAKIRFHFMYLRTKQPTLQEIKFVENSSDIYSIFSKITKSTDGLKLTGNNPRFLFKNIERLIQGSVKVEVIKQDMEKEEKNKEI